MTQDFATGLKAVELLKLKRKERTLTRNMQLKKDFSLRPRIEQLRVRIKELTDEVISSTIYKQLIATFLLAAQLLSLSFNSQHEDYRLHRMQRNGRRKHETSIYVEPEEL